MSSTTFSYSNNIPIRGCLTSEGIRIKNQFILNKVTGGDGGGGGDDDYDYDYDLVDYHNSIEDKINNPLNYCVDPCLIFPNSQTQSINNKIVIPSGTIIPFSRIIYAQYTNVHDTILRNTQQRAQIYKILQNNHSTCFEEEKTSLLHYYNTSTDKVNTTCAQDSFFFFFFFFLKNYKSLNIINNLIELTFVHPMGKNIIVPTKINLLMDPLPLFSTFDLVSHIIEKSYQNVRKEKNILIIINPYGGSGKALKKFNQYIKPILDVSPFINYEIMFTEYHQHAINIARELDINKFDTIACCSGDGIPNEVINGLYQRPDRAQAFNKICVTQLPCGSGNAMSVSCHWTTNPSYSALCLLKSIESRIDLMCCQQLSYIDNHPRLSFLSQTFGVIAESDVNTEFIRWMGPIRFDIGVAFNILKFKNYPCDIYVKYAAKTKGQLGIHYLHNKSKAQVPMPTQTTLTDDSQTVSDSQQFDFNLKYSIKDPVPDDWERIDPNITDNLSIFYTGKMPYMAKDAKFFPAALPADGTIDMILTDTRTPIHKITPILLSLDKGTHVCEPEVVHSKILAYRLVPKIDNTVISVDGESFPPEPLQVEIIPGLLKTLLRNGSYVDTEFDSYLERPPTPPPLTERRGKTN